MPFAVVNYLQSVIGTRNVHPMTDHPIEHPLRAARRAANVDIETLAERCDLSVGSIYAIERNAMVPSTTNALRIARALGTTVEAIFGGLADAR